MISLKEAQDSLKSTIVDSPKKVENCKEKMKDTVQKLRNSRVGPCVVCYFPNCLVFIQIVLFGGVERKDIQLQGNC